MAGRYDNFKGINPKHYPILGLFIAGVVDYVYADDRPPICLKIPHGSKVITDLDRAVYSAIRRRKFGVCIPGMIWDFGFPLVNVSYRVEDCWDGVKVYLSVDDQVVVHNLQKTTADSLFIEGGRRLKVAQKVCGKAA